MNFPGKDSILFCQQIGQVITARVSDSAAWENPVRLADAFLDFSLFFRDRGDIRVIVLSGFEQNNPSPNPPAPHPGSLSKQRFSPGVSVSRQVASWAIPVIAAVEGSALGLAFEVILACDLRIAAETSRFGFPYIRKGLIPWDGGSQRLSRIVGPAKALELILTGEEVPGQEAKRIGLIHKMVPPPEVMESALNLAQEISQKAPLALRFAKEAVFKGMEMTLDQGLHLEADLYFLLQTTKDRTEGIQAFQQKRRPKFEGK